MRVVSLTALFVVGISGSGLVRAQALDPQASALQALTAASATPVEGTAAQGAVRLVALDVAAVGATATEQAAQFLVTYGGALGQSGPAQGFALRTIRREGPDGQLLLASFAQTYRGIPVFGADATVAIEPSPLGGSPRVTRMSGALAPDPDLAGGLDTTPSLGPETCVAAARAFLAQPTAELLAPARLLVYDGQLFGQTPGARLVWAVTLNPQPFPPGGGPTQVLCDAQTASVVFDRPFFFGDANFDVSRAVIDGTPPEGWSRHFLGDDDGLTLEGAAHADAAPEWTYAHQVYNYLAANYGWRGPNGTDGLYRIIVDAATGQCAQYSINKYIGDSIFVDPGCAGYDVTAHETGHAIIAYGSKLIYKFQSGALNEGYADATGVAIDFWDWLIGEDRTSGDGALRDFQTPPKFSQPDRFSQYVNLPASNDGGGVHTNSGILNKAHYLIATGDAFNFRPAFTGIGRFKMGTLAFFAMRFLPSSATFADARAEEVWLAQTLANYSFFGFAPSDVCAVKSGFAAVEVEPARGDFDCNGIEDGCADADMDFVCAPPDNCPAVANPNQKDWDMDGDGDACDVDMDNDGRPDAADNCPSNANWDQRNTDGDPFGDACDPDDDNDGLWDPFDNCPLVYNPGQEDGDMDGIADACGDFDYDGDGWYDDDNCTFVYNDLQFDSDGDGLGDACDGCPNTADWTGAYEAYTQTPPPRPLQPDSDGDGTPDACDPLGFGAVAFDVNGLPYNPSQTWVPGGSAVNGMISGPGGSRFRIPVALCPAVGPGPIQIPEIVFTNLDASVDVALRDDDGLLIGLLRPGPAGSGSRGVRVRPDCSRTHYLEFSTTAAFPGATEFLVQTAFVDESTANPWVTLGSGLPPPPPPPDVDGDGLLDSNDRCPTLFEPAGVDADGDGVSDICDTCSATPNPLFAGSTVNRTLVSGQLDDDADGRGDRCDFDHDGAGAVVTSSDFNLMKAAVGKLVGQSACPAPTGPCGKFDHDEAGSIVTATDFNLMKAAVGKLVSSYPKCTACSPPWSPPVGATGGVVLGRPTCQGPACTYVLP